MLLSKKAKLSFSIGGTRGDDLSLIRARIEKLEPYRCVELTEEEFTKLLEEGMGAMLQAFEDKAKEMFDEEHGDGRNDTQDN